LSFSADIDPVTSTLSGSVSASGGTLTGVGTSFQTDLSAGDYIVVDGQMVRITANPSSQEAATVPSTFSFTGKAYSLATTEIVEPGNNSLLFPLPYYAVRSMRQAGTGGINDTSYTLLPKDYSDCNWYISYILYLWYVCFLRRNRQLHLY